MSHMVNFAEAAAVISGECVCLPTRQASRALTKLYDEALRPTGLQASQLTVLVAVARFGEGGAPIGALSAAIVMDRTTLTRNLGPLERARLVRVARDPGDARLRVVLLTREGERAIERAFPLWQRAQERVRARAGEGQVAGVREGLVRLMASLGAAAEGGAKGRGA